MNQIKYLILSLLAGLNFATFHAVEETQGTITEDSSSEEVSSEKVSSEKDIVFSVIFAALLMPVIVIALLLWMVILSLKKVFYYTYKFLGFVFKLFSWIWNIVGLLFFFLGLLVCSDDSSSFLVKFYIFFVQTWIKEKDFLLKNLGELDSSWKDYSKGGLKNLKKIKNGAWENFDEVKKMVKKGDSESFLCLIQSLFAKLGEVHEDNTQLDFHIPMPMITDHKYSFNTLKVSVQAAAV